MSYYFLVTQRGKEIGSRIKLENRQITIGRNTDNDIVLNDPLVSRYHSVIQTDKIGNLKIIDLGSTNGVLVNESKLEPGNPRSLQNRDVIYIGSSVFNLQVRGDDYQPAQAPSRATDKDATQILDYKQLYS